MSRQSDIKSIYSSFWELANPKVFLTWTAIWLPWIAVLGTICLSVGLIWGFFFTPDDVRQGSTVKIIYLHVPSALMAINGYFLIVIGSLFWLIRRQHISVLASKAAAPVGMTMTLIAIATGAIWGQPMWGTYWVWDPRLTSFLILLLFYIIYILGWKIYEDQEKANRITSLIAVVGVINIPIIKFSVDWWSTLH